MENINEEEYGASYIACKKCGSLFPAGDLKTVKYHFKNCTGDPQDSGASLMAVEMRTSEKIPKKPNSQHQQDAPQQQQDKSRGRPRSTPQQQQDIPHGRGRPRSTPQHQQDAPHGRPRSAPALPNKTVVEPKDPERLPRAKTPSANNLSVETMPHDLPVEDDMSLDTITPKSTNNKSTCQSDVVASKQGKIMPSASKSSTSSCSRIETTKEPPRIIKKCKRPSWPKTPRDLLMATEVFKSITQMDDEAMMSTAYDMAIYGLSEKLEAAMNNKSIKRNRTSQNENRATPVAPSQDGNRATTRTSQNENHATPVDALQEQNKVTPQDPSQDEKRETPLNSSEDGNSANKDDTSDLYNGIPKSMLRNSEYFLKLKQIKDKYGKHCEINYASTDQTQPGSDVSIGIRHITPILEPDIGDLSPKCRKKDVEQINNGNMVLSGDAMSTASNPSSGRITRSQKPDKIRPLRGNASDELSDATASSSPMRRPQRQAAAKFMSRLPSFRNNEGAPEIKQEFEKQCDQIEPEGDVSMETIDTAPILESDIGNLQPDFRKNKGNYRCDLCGHKTKHVGFFKRHMAAHNDGGVHVCTFDGCKYTCLLKSRLKLHMKTHTLVRGKNLVCETCGALFSDSGSLNRHKGLHSETLPYVCGECGYASAYKNALTEHSRKHSETYLQCDYEGCTFRSIYGRALQTHRRSHDDSKKLICELCGFTTPDKGTFQMHKKVHTGKKDYQCSRCKYQGYTKSEVARHYRGVHLKEKTYCCDQCDFKSSYLTGLRVHLMAHAGIKPFQCSACPYASSLPAKTKRHIKKVHPDAKLIKLNIPFQFDVKKYKPAQTNPRSDIVIIKLMDGADSDRTEMKSSIYSVDNDQPETESSIYSVDNDQPETESSIYSVEQNEVAMAESPNAMNGTDEVMLKKLAIVSNVILAYMCLDCSSFYSHKEEFETHLAECATKDCDDSQMETHLPESFIIEDGALTIIEDVN